VVTSREKAKALSVDPGIEIQVVSYGFSRAKKGFMAMAVVPAVKMALDKAGLSVKEMKAIKTHNPFAVNDLYLAKEMGIDWKDFNNYGCSMIFGHPQGPTAGRCIIEGIEEVVMQGGGYLLWGGCAAGDTGASIVLKIG
jgi:acetyl-CoA C-acetyltransferase